MPTFDYLVVGAGSAGCVLAAKLAEGGASVAVIEAGGSDRSPVFHIPKGFAFTIDNPAKSWVYETEPFGPLGQTEHWSRGRVLGGSSAINGMVWNRGAQADWDGLAADGNPGWGWDDILPIYRAMEDHQLGASDLRGAGGPVHISVQAEGDEVGEAMLGAASAVGMKRVDDLNASDDDRVGFGPANIRKGLRQSAAKTFLRPAMKRKNVTVLTKAMATRILFEGDRAVGVEISRGNGANEEVRATREVILTAGNIETPALLERSGIGRADVLGDAGVEVRLDRELVGEQCREHRWFPLQLRLNRHIGYNRLLHKPSRQALSGLQYLATRKGPVATPAYDMVGFLKSRPGLDRPDAQILMTPFSQGHFSLELGVEEQPGMSIIGYPLRPTSFGSTHIRSTDPMSGPRIVTGYLASEYDRTVFVDLFARMREIVQQHPLVDLVKAESMPGAALQDPQGILDAGMINGGTSYHAAGACAMGSDESAVVDPALRVRGVDGLRIIDASVLPVMVAGNLNAPLMAMGWRAAELILGES
ncbi:MAG TPA: GMC family oxidoreductase N-terminal domain-containing protein [Marmoricola sp.]|jgi:choline dehydrogenase-like flavoprotein|nr:GMC family oxidoreductase N-terminal domain-containing protein [Marmoricola sp.]